MSAVALSLTFLHVIGWAAYAGGAVIMEVAWRPAQAHIPPSQVNVVCGTMGRRYRWLALASLGLIAATGVALLVEAGYISPSAPVFRPPLTLDTAYGRTMLALAVCWVALVTLVSAMAMATHPALHVRTSPSMSEEDRQVARESLRLAIRRMDALLRTELALTGVALLLGASLPFGGLL